MHGFFIMKRGKISFSNSVKIYFSLLKKAWQSTWLHKTLWPIAALAGLANTGAVFNNVTGTFWRVQSTDSLSVNTINDTLVAFPWITAYIESVITLDTVRLTLTIVGVIVFFILISILIISAQQLILLHAHKQTRSKKHLDFEHLIHDLKHLHLWRIFSVNTSVFLLSTVILLLSASLLSLILTPWAAVNTLIYLGCFLVLLPLSFLINALGMFSLIFIVRLNKGLIEAVKSAARLIRNHWLTAFELAVLLYFVNLAAAGIFYLGLIIIAIPAAFLVFAAVALNSIYLMYAITAVAVICLIFMLVMFTGAVTMFNYNVWAHLIERLEKFAFLPSLEAVVRKFSKS
jgi:hypothetical protein